MREGRRRTIIRMGYKPRKLFKAIVAIDTSGSITDEDIDEFFSQVKWLFARTDAEIELAFFDTRICRKEKVRSLEDLKMIDRVPDSRGGTSYREVLEYSIEKEASELIVFTDGYGDQYDLKPVPRGLRIWWLTTSSKKFPFGEIVSIRGDKNGE